VVYCLGRSSEALPANQRPVLVATGLNVTVELAADTVTARGGIGHAVPCDLSLDGVIEEIVTRVVQETGRFDLLEARHDHVGCRQWFRTTTSLLVRGLSCRCTTYDCQKRRL
jgi:hypothetical protein